MNETKIITGTKTIIGTAEVWTEGDERKVYIKPFTGCVLEVDLRRYSFKSAQEAAAFVCKMIDRAGYDSLVLSNLSPAKRKETGS